MAVRKVWCWDFYDAENNWVDQRFTDRQEAEEYAKEKGYKSLRINCVHNQAMDELDIEI